MGREKERERGGVWLEKPQPVKFDAGGNSRAVRGLSGRRISRGRGLTVVGGGGGGRGWNFG